MPLMAQVQEVPAGDPGTSARGLQDPGVRGTGVIHIALVVTIILLLIFVAYLYLRRRRIGSRRFEMDEDKPDIRSSE